MILEFLAGVLFLVIVIYVWFLIKKDNEKINNYWNGKSEDE